MASAIDPEINAELTMSLAIVAKGAEVAPRFLTDDVKHGRLIMVCQWPQDKQAQIQAFTWIHDFLFWCQATRFILSSELVEPPGVVVVAVGCQNASLDFQSVEPDGGAIGESIIGADRQIDPLILDLLPRGSWWSALMSRAWLPLAANLASDHEAKRQHLRGW